MSRRSLVSASAFALALTAFAPVAVARAAQAVPHEVVVGIRPAGGATARASEPKVRVLKVRNVARAIRSLRRRSGLAYAVPNVVARASEFRLPNDPGRT